MTGDALLPILIACIGVAGAIATGRMARRTQVETAHLGREANETKTLIDTQTNLLDRYERRIGALEADVVECHTGRAADRADAERREQHADEQLQHCRAEIDRLEQIVRARP